MQCGPGEQETGVSGAAAADNKPWGDLNNKERHYIISLTSYTSNVIKQASALMSLSLYFLYMLLRHRVMTNPFKVT